MSQSMGFQREPGPSRQAPLSTLPTPIPPAVHPALPGSLPHSGSGFGAVHDVKPRTGQDVAQVTVIYRTEEKMSLPASGHVALNGLQTEFLVCPVTCIEAPLLSRVTQMRTAPHFFP